MKDVKLDILYIIFFTMISVQTLLSSKTLFCPPKVTKDLFPYPMTNGVITSLFKLLIFNCLVGRVVCVVVRAYAAVDLGFLGLNRVEDNYIFFC